MTSTRFSSAGPRNDSPVVKLAGGVDRLAGIGVAPAADGVEVLEAEAERVEPGVARRRTRASCGAFRAAGGRSASCRSSARRPFSAGPSAAAAAARRRATPPAPTCRAAPGWSAADTTSRSGRPPSRARRRGCGPSAHPAELGALHAGDAVVLRQLFVDERVVGVEQVDDVTSSRKTASTNTTASSIIASRSFGRVLGTTRAASPVCNSRDSEPLAGEAVGHRRPSGRRASAGPAARARPGRAACPRRRGGTARRRASTTRGSTTAAMPARSRSIAYGSVVAVAIVLDAEEELRRDQHRPSAPA